MVACKRTNGAGGMLEHDLEREARHELEGRQLVARALAQALEEVERRMGGCAADEGDAPASWAAETASAPRR